MSKKSVKINELVDIEKLYSFEEALSVFQEVKSNKFDESVDIAINLGIDAGKSDQNVRGSVTLPNSLGKQVTVAAATVTCLPKELGKVTEPLTF